MSGPKLIIIFGTLKQQQFMSNTVLNDICSYSLDGATKMKQLALCFLTCSFIHWSWNVLVGRLQSVERSTLFVWQAHWLTHWQLFLLYTMLWHIPHSSAINRQAWMVDTTWHDRWLRRRVHIGQFYSIPIHEITTQQYNAQYDDVTMWNSGKRVDTWRIQYNTIQDIRHIGTTACIHGLKRFNFSSPNLSSMSGVNNRQHS